MILVKFEKFDDKFVSLNVSGHANFANKGEDLVCAGVSSIVFGALNAFDKLANEHFKMEVLDNLIKVETLSNACITDKLLNFVYIQLLTIKDQYPDNINIKII